MSDARKEARRRIAEVLAGKLRPVPAISLPTLEWQLSVDEVQARFAGQLADAVLDLCEVTEEWRVDGTDPPADDADEEGDGWFMFADDAAEAHRLAEKHGGTALVALKLWLPVAGEATS